MTETEVWTDETKAIVRDTFKEGWLCIECNCCHHSNEAVPYGDGSATRHLRTCLARIPADCPGVWQAEIDRRELGA